MKPFFPLFIWLHFTQVVCKYGAVYAVIYMKTSKSFPISRECGVVCLYTEHEIQPQQHEKLFQFHIVALRRLSCHVNCLPTQPQVSGLWWDVVSFALYVYNRQGFHVGTQSGQLFTLTSTWAVDFMCCNCCMLSTGFPQPELCLFLHDSIILHILIKIPEFLFAWTWDFGRNSS